MQVADGCCGCIESACCSSDEKWSCHGGWLKSSFQVFLEYFGILPFWEFLMALLPLVTTDFVEAVFTSVN